MDEPASPFESLDVAPVINAAGKLTALGGSAQAPAVAAAQAGAAQAHVDLAELRAAAGARVAARCGAEAGCITSGAAAGLCVAVAAVLTGDDLERVRRVPDALDGPREVVMQAGHDVDFGARVEQMVRLGGGRPVIAGAADRVTEADVRAVLSERTACLLWVQSHHARQSDRLALAALVALAREHNVPLLVDAAAEDDLERYVSAGADLTIYSGGKALGGPTVGFVVGKAPLVAACERQGRGIARPMKVGKEPIMGLMAALGAYPTSERWRPVLDALIEALAPLPGLRVERVPDRAGRAVERAGLRADHHAFEPAALVTELAAGSPSIRTRNHQLAEGLIQLDPRELAAAHVPIIATRVAAFLRGRAVGAKGM